MTTHTQRADVPSTDERPWELEPDFRPIENLADLVESARRAVAKIPLEERSEGRERMVAYLDEVAAREPSQPPHAQAE